MTQPIADVLVFRHVPTLYTYTIPPHLKSIEPGTHVTVPLGKSIAEGVIITRSESAQPSLKPIIDPTAGKPILQPDILALITWFYPHYHCSPLQAYQTIVGTKKARPEPPLHSPVPQIEPHTLTPEQTEALTQILTGNTDTYLLHGITGSGKTEIYIHAAHAILNQNKSVIILVPEIALTPQFMQIFTARFADQPIGILHSGLTPKSRDITWSNIQNGTIRLVIGPRSALFAPIHNLGLIIIDEAHDHSYKNETHPRYDTLTIAKKRCEFAPESAKLVLGTATPSIEQFHAANTQAMTYLPLTKRAQNQPLPTLHIIDMNQEIPERRTTLSHALETAIRDRLEKKQKSILLINRRGFAPYISCQKCGKIHACPSCQLSLTYHTDKTFRCHRCDTTSPLTHTCRYCKKNSLTFGGIGIQKIESELKKIFPAATILRLDRDTGKNARSIEHILSTFKENGDILIGTQMIAKGHHIDTVTLVGILGIDMTLNMPDFRAPENTFQLITQVAGRAGRGITPGTVYIQTHQPEHDAIHFASTHNYTGFYHHEISIREVFLYPPFSQLTHIILSAKNLRDIQTYATQLYTTLRTQLPETHRITSPAPAPIEKIKYHHRWHILIKSPPNSTDILTPILSHIPHPPKTLKCIIDTEPRTLL